MVKYILSFIPLVGTSIGSALGIWNNFKGKFKKEEDFLVAVATGILGCITFDLFFESLENIRNLRLFIGIVIGFLFIFFMNIFAHHITISKKSKLFWAMLIHNIPEGILIGISLVDTSIIKSLSLILSISLQNIPDGLVVSLPLVSVKGKKYALLMGVLSGIVEPISAILIFSASNSNFISILEPFLIGFSFSSILMIFLELFKECKHLKTIGVTAILTYLFSTVLTAF